MMMEITLTELVPANGGLGRFQSQTPADRSMDLLSKGQSNSNNSILKVGRNKTKCVSEPDQTLFWTGP